ncbi:MAG: transporter substrate-binding domain-containing protein [Nitrososphaera sp.]|nr:transporter substrate-binding domain-containing protein [Nitrososphaera sp.]
MIKDPESGQLSGIYPDMVAEIARALNVKIDWHETTLANFVAGLQSDQFDFSVGATFITVPRALAVSFTQPVAYVGNSGVVKTGGKFRPSTIRDLNTPRVRIAVLQGQALEEYCRRNVPKAELVVISGGDLTAPLVAVSSGQADIGLMNSVTVAQYAADHPEVTAVFTGGQQIEILPLAWATRPRDNDLLSFLNSSITYLKSTGRLEGYQKKYSVQLLYDTPKLHKAF